MTTKLNIWKYTAYLTLFLIPTQLALHFWPNSSLVFGIRVDYLSPAIYLTDILVIFLLVLRPGSLLTFLNTKRKVILVVLLFVFLNTVFSLSWQPTLYKWFKYIEYLFFGLWIYLEKKNLGQVRLVKVLVCSACFFGAIGIAQFLLGHTTGFFRFLGERSFNSTMPGIALIELFGSLMMRSYSTFPHPNSMAGYLGIVIILLLNMKKVFAPKVFYSLLLLLTLSFTFTFSLGAVAGLVTVLIFSFVYRHVKYLPGLFLFGSVVLSLLIPLFSRMFFTFFQSFGSTVTERVVLALIAGKTVYENLYIGGGLNTFVLNIPKHSGLGGSSWLLQPVHNIFILLLVETGMVGLISFVSLLYKLFVRRNFLLTTILVFVVATGFFDHYWLTLQQNTLLLTLLVGLLL